MSGTIWGHQGCIGAGRECRYSGTRRGIGHIGGIGALLGVLGESGGIRGCSGYEGCIGAGRECRYSRASRGIVA